MASLWALSTGKPLPYNLGWLIIGLTFVLASFMAWRRERQYVCAKSQKTEADLRQRDQIIQTLNAQLAQKPQISAHELANQALVRELIANATKEERSFLEYLLNHEELQAEQVYREHARPVINSSVYKWQHKLIKIRQDTRNGETFWAIVPGLRPALAYLLYEPPEA